ncbi:hypothetical protein FMM56_00965 [Campylobacter sp. LR264d]|uniref:hypothetical protein n=1 Tax=Campylobacter sp. LR264d TaxID=2593544 RepID=UPI0012395E30|nr:hypothetical protein [Campylobacter sp. LR264d]KAA6234356.1 hypothetical protein FMM56_00965 [Campylobacter sp. LR264d]
MLNEFDDREEQLELAALQKELEQAGASIEKDFASYMAKNTTSELEELFFENKEAFYMQILQNQNIFLEENINPKLARSKELEGKISEKKSLSNIQAAAQNFLQSHPDVDINDLMRFFIEELGAKVKTQIESLPPEQFFEALYELYKRANKEEVINEPLPKKLSGVPSDTTQRSMQDNDLPTQRL